MIHDRLQNETLAFILIVCLNFDFLTRLILTPNYLHYNSTCCCLWLNQNRQTSNIVRYIFVAPDRQLIKRMIMNNRFSSKTFMFSFIKINKFLSFITSVILDGVAITLNLPEIIFEEALIGLYFIFQKETAWTDVRNLCYALERSCQSLLTVDEVWSLYLEWIV